LRRVNPSFPHRVGERAILRNKKGLSEDSVFREVFGLWDDVDGSKRVIPTAVWDGRVAEDPPAQDEPPSALAADMGHDRVVSIDGCWLDPETGACHVEILALDQTPDAAGAVDWLAERAGRKIPVVIDELSLAAEMIPLLKKRNVKVIITRTHDMSKACSGFYGDVVAGRLTHAGQGQLDDALAGAKSRKIGDAGGWGWDRRDPTVNIAPLVAATLARFGAVVTKPRVPNSGKVVVLT
jgi:hypothetical protein